VLTTGCLAPELAATQALALERPTTAERQQGRCPLTVLQPRPDPGTAVRRDALGASASGGRAAAAALAAGGRAPQERAASQSESGDGRGQPAADGVGAGGPGARGSRGVTIADAPAAEGLLQQQDGGISLKVGAVVGAGRNLGGDQPPPSRTHTHNSC
jgi:hypothetical protein